MARKSVAATVVADAEEPVVAEVVTVAEVEEPVLTAAEVETLAEAVVVAVPKPAIGAIGKMAESLLVDASLNYLQILERIADAFPTARTSRRSLASVAADMRRRGVDVPMRNGAQTA